MENKYYTPTISEFYIGFELEISDKSTNGWQEASLSPIDLQELMNASCEWKCRVKYLDKEDIESLGWKHTPTKGIGKEQYEGLFKSSLRGKMLFEHDWLNNKITIKTPNWIRNGSGNFDGYIIYINGLIIKNKSELVALMNQLGIYDKRDS